MFDYKCLNFAQRTTLISEATCKKTEQVYYLGFKKLFRAIAGKFLRLLPIVTKFELRGPDSFGTLVFCFVFFIWAQRCGKLCHLTTQNTPKVYILGSSFVIIYNLQESFKNCKHRYLKLTFPVEMNRNAINPLQPPPNQHYFSTCFF